jgi:hypothetical protein
MAWANGRAGAWRMVLPPMVIALWRLALGKGFEGLPIHIEYSQAIANPLMMWGEYKNIDRSIDRAGRSSTSRKPLWMITKALVIRAVWGSWAARSWLNGVSGLITISRHY